MVKIHEVALFGKGEDRGERHWRRLEIIGIFDDPDAEVLNNAIIEQAVSTLKQRVELAKNIRNPNYGWRYRFAVRRVGRWKFPKDGVWEFYKKRKDDERVMDMTAGKQEWFEHELQMMRKDDDSIVLASELLAQVPYPFVPLKDGDKVVLAEGMMHKVMIARIPVDGTKPYYEVDSAPFVEQVKDVKPNAGHAGTAAYLEMILAHSADEALVPDGSIKLHPVDGGDPFIILPPRGQETGEIAKDDGQSG